MAPAISPRKGRGRLKDGKSGVAVTSWRRNDHRDPARTGNGRPCGASSQAPRRRYDHGVRMERQAFRGDLSEVKRLQRFEEEGDRPKRLFGDPMLDNAASKGFLGVNW